MDTASGVNNEDPFVFFNPSSGGSWHIINHQQSKGNVCGSPTAGHACGAHWFARDAHGPWRMSPEPAYTPEVQLTNGSTAVYQTRQRPQIVFDPADGVTPTYLFNGGSFEGNNPDLNMLTHTFAQRFR